jgi:choline dehydrogenase-like flavoprotein
MICNSASESLPEVLDTDVCIIGAGLAGMTLALTFARRKVDVVLMEFGGVAIEPEIQELYRSEVAGRSHTGKHDRRVW